MNELNPQLIISAQKGDSDAINELIRQTHSCVFAAAYALLRNVQDAEDVTQEVYLRMFRSFGSMNNPDTFIPWLRKITVNCCRTYHSKSSKC